jgi:hypothetical protein
VKVLIADGPLVDRARRLPGWTPQYHIHDVIGHSLQWAAIRDEILTG